MYLPETRYVVFEEGSISIALYSIQHRAADRGGLHILIHLTTKLHTHTGKNNHELKYHFVKIIIDYQYHINFYDEGYRKVRTLQYLVHLLTSLQRNF